MQIYLLKLCVIYLNEIFLGRNVGNLFKIIIDFSLMIFYVNKMLIDFILVKFTFWKKFYSQNVIDTILWKEIFEIY